MMLESIVLYRAVVGMKLGISAGFAGAKYDTVAEPFGEPLLIDLATCDTEHRIHGVVGGGWVGHPDPLVEIHEQHQTGPRSSFVAVGHRVVPRHPARQHCGFVVEARIEVGFAEPCSGRVEL